MLSAAPKGGEKAGPEAIYRAYKAVLPNAKRKILDESEMEGANANG
jgi:hypothetical protein